MSSIMLSWRSTLLCGFLTQVFKFAPGVADNGCKGFGHLENGRMFFRYGGLYVTFACNPGFRIHGYRTSSCMSGQWARDPPLCVASGCPSLGDLLHGHSVVSRDRSLASFSCNYGFNLFGSALLYCKGKDWNSTKPVCKVADIMSGHLKQEFLQGPLSAHILTKLNAISTKHLNTSVVSPSNNALLNLQKIPRMRPDLSDANIRKPSEKQPLKSPILEQVTTPQNLQDSNRSLFFVLESNVSLAFKEEKKGHVMDSVSYRQNKRLHLAVLATPVSGSENLPLHHKNKSKPYVTASGTYGHLNSDTFTSENAEIVPFKRSPDLIEFKHKYVSSPSFTSHPLNTTGHPTISSQGLTTTSNNRHTVDKADQRQLNKSLPQFPSRENRPVCPYPSFPLHGTFYFRSIKKPRPLQSKHYIQYACYPGYTLTDGDVYSYCLHNGEWSGKKPQCVAISPCSINNGGCSQTCNVQHNQAQCRCKPGFLLLEDQRTCRDLDECVEQLHMCQQACENTFGSYRCSCNPGFQLSSNETSCTDVDECQYVGRALCSFGCINTPGSFQCLCAEGYQLDSTGGHCEDINECEQMEGIRMRVFHKCQWKCENLSGSYRCLCPPGFKLHSDRRHCV